MTPLAQEKDEAMAKFKADRAKLAAAPRASDGGVEGKLDAVGVIVYYLYESYLASPALYYASRCLGVVL